MHVCLEIEQKNKAHTYFPAHLCASSLDNDISDIGTSESLIIIGSADLFLSITKQCHFFQCIAHCHDKRENKQKMKIDEASDWTMDILVGVCHLTAFRHLLLKLHMDYPKVQVVDMSEP